MEDPKIKIRGVGGGIGNVREGEWGFQGHSNINASGNINFDGKSGSISAGGEFDVSVGVSNQDGVAVLKGDNSVGITVGYQKEETGGISIGFDIEGKREMDYDASVNGRDIQFDTGYSGGFGGSITIGGPGGISVRGRGSIGAGADVSGSILDGNGAINDRLEPSGEYGFKEQPWQEIKDPFNNAISDVTVFFAYSIESITCHSNLNGSQDIERLPISNSAYFGSTPVSSIAQYNKYQHAGSIYNQGRDFYGTIFYPGSSTLFGIPKKERQVVTFIATRRAFPGVSLIGGKWRFYPAGSWVTGEGEIVSFSDLMKPFGEAYTSENLSCGNPGNVKPAGSLAFPKITGYAYLGPSSLPARDPFGNPNLQPNRPYMIEYDTDDLGDNDMSDCCTCTNDSNARLLAEIEKIRKWLGAGDKIEVPEHLLTDKAQIHRDELDLAKKVQLENFAEILEWYLGNLSGWLGAWGRNVKTKKQVPKQIIEKINGVDVVRIEYEDKDVGLDLPDVATCFELLTAMLLDMQDDNARALQASYSATVEAHQARQQSTMANYGIQAVIDAIGGFVHIEEKRKKLPALLSFPSESELKKLAEKPYEQQVEKLLTPSEIEITVSDFKDNTVTLSEALIKLLEAASVIKGCFTIPIAKGETPMEVGEKLKQLVSDGYLSRSQISAMFEDNLANAEKGYNVFPDPWGESWEQRPKIRNTRMIDRDNTLANGDGIGGSI